MFIDFFNLNLIYLPDLNTAYNHTKKKSDSYIASVVFGRYSIDLSIKRTT